MDSPSTAGECPRIDATKFDAVSFDVYETILNWNPGSPGFRAALADLRAMGTPLARVLHVAQSRRADIVVATRSGSGVSG